MDVLIWGAGAVGGALGAHFVRAGHEILFADPVREHVDALNECGLKITGPVETFSVPATHPPETLDGAFGHILCGRLTALTVNGGFSTTSRSGA